MYTEKVPLGAAVALRWAFVEIPIRCRGIELESGNEVSAF
jgi:hypothetical protein